MSILLLLIVAASCSEIHYLRYKDGKIKVNEEVDKLSSGLIYAVGIEGRYRLIYTGMIPEEMTPFSVGGEFYNSASVDIDISIPCTEALLNDLYIKKMNGTMKLTGTWQKLKVEGTCVSYDGTNTLKFSGEGNHVESYWYKPEEAAARAKNLIGKNIEVHKPSAFLSYAISDMRFLAYSCHVLANKLTPNSEQKTGYVIISEDKKRCGIMSEDKKFIHANTETSKIEELEDGDLEKIFGKNSKFMSYPPPTEAMLE